MIRIVYEKHSIQREHLREIIQLPMMTDKVIPTVTGYPAGINGIRKFRHNAPASHEIKIIS